MKKVIQLLLIVLISFFSESIFAAATSDQYLAAGNQLYQSRNYDKALLYYKAAVQVDPGNAAAYQRLGNTYYQLGQKSDALTAYQRALALNPNNTQLANFVQALQAQLGSGLPAIPAAAKPSVTVDKTFEFNAGLGVASGGLAGLGFGGTASGYFLVEKHLGLGGSLGVYDFSYSSTVNGGIPIEYTEVTTDSDSLLAIEVLASGKYYFDGKGLKPYLIGGLGLSMLSLSTSSSDVVTYLPPYNAPPYSFKNSSTTSTSSASAMNPMAQVGAGLTMDLGGLSLFGEVKYSYVFSTLGTGSYIPINIGLSF